MMLPLIAATTALAIAMGLFAAYRISGRRDADVRRRVLSRSGDLRLASASILRNEEHGSLLGRLMPLSAARRERIAHELELGGRPMRPGEFVSLRLIVALAGAAAGFVLAAVFGWPALAAAASIIALAFVGWMLPSFQLKRAQDKRARQIEQQLPEALMAIAKSLRAGTGLLQALAYAAEETPAPLGDEIRASLRDLELGAEPDDVFGDLARRVGSPDLDIAITAILIQRNVGGNLSEILFNVTSTIRERIKLQGEIRVLTSRQRLTGNLVAALPVFIAGLFMLINPDIAERLFTTGAGRIALAVGIGFEVLGLYLIRRLAVVEV